MTTFLSSFLRKHSHLTTSLNLLYLFSFFFLIFLPFINLYFRLRFYLPSPSGDFFLHQSLLLHIINLNWLHFYLILLLFHTRLFLLSLLYLPFYLRRFIKVNVKRSVIDIDIRKYTNILRMYIHVCVYMLTFVAQNRYYL